MLALLALIALPGLTETRERARKARCLSNLRNLAAAAHAYANEDSRELLIPIHQMSVSTLHTDGWVGPLTGLTGGTYTPGNGAVRIGMAYSFGGKTATAPFGPTTVMTDPNGYWGAATRPLNPYVTGSTHDPSIEDAQSFACPADAGYPISIFTTDAPLEIANVPCFDVAGNSYRVPTCGYFWTATSGGSNGSFSTSVYGKSRSSLQQTDRLMLFVEPMLYSAGRILGIPQPPNDNLPTWHGEAFSDQMALADGSARMAFARQFIDWSVFTLNEMNVANDNSWYFYLRKSTLWTTDAYPTPGTRIVMRRPDGTVVTPNVPSFQLNRWPYLNHTVID
jgi:hypothetical protein